MTMDDRGILATESEVEDIAKVDEVLRRLHWDMVNNPGVLKPVDPALVRLAYELTAGVEVDLDSPLPPEDD
jgi:hypothetical protein